MPRFTAPRRISALLLALPLAAGAQDPQGSVLRRTPNMVTNWVNDPWTIQFNFIHRFTESGPPQHQISNTPTFFVAAGMPARTSLGFAYSTSSEVVALRPNEWEFFLRNMPFRPGNKVADVTLHLGHNVGAASTDGELGIARSFGALRLLGAARGFSNAFGEGDARLGYGGGVNLKLMKWLAAAGDVNSMHQRRTGERIGWSGGLMFGIPTTPHSLSIYATNTVTATLEGLSLGTRHTRWGFEYTVPITLARYIPALRPKSAPVVAAASDSTPPAAAVAATPEPAPVPVTPTPTPTEPAAPTPTAPIPVTKDAPATPTPTPMPTATATPAPAAAAPTPTAPRTTPRPTSAAAPARRDTVRATMRQLEFAPTRIEVAAGTTVIWTNNAPLQHSIVADNGSFDSGLIDPGKRYARTFTKPGTYTFHCTPHPFMKGVVVVR
ncbi:blue (type 1) copper domain protein [Gemmatirosa kalamazoonensis]|uniref:Blue (Type 1) copper domain protein n=1 Tax=Gemmatirosa kalamazoonensis TaxID=861299 RepID=W0REZ2_9BACT|nr:plastocyanin/azurin family copper-binding protein [Gemmatirosa kalamazoonensis]AHG89356.1 blue (type 1) copper domain protein [Gemmatirosa kalamazoonensis]